jgi:hypothetical protein
MYLLGFSNTIHDAAPDTTFTTVPASSVNQSAGWLTGIAHRNNHFASSGRMFTQPLLIGLPKLSCQYVPWKATPVETKKQHHGTPGNS